MTMAISLVTEAVVAEWRRRGCHRQDLIPRHEDRDLDMLNDDHGIGAAWLANEHCMTVMLVGGGKPMFGSYWLDPSFGR